MKRLLNTLMQYLSREVKPDLLFVTGDLVDVPFYLMEEIRAGRGEQRLIDAMYDDYLLVREFIDAANVPYHVIPGNHDYPPAFRDVFSQHTRYSEFEGIKVASFPCDKETAGHVPYRDYADYPERTEWQSADVHLQHYVITPECDGKYPHTYGNANEILKLNAQSPPLLSLSGHYHPGTGPVQVGDTTYIVGAAFSDRPHPWYLYEVDPKVGTVVTGTLNFAERLSRVTPIVPVDFSELPSPPSIHSKRYAVLANAMIEERERDRIWSDLDAAGHNIVGLYAFSDTEEYRTAFAFFK